MEVFAGIPSASGDPDSELRIDELSRTLLGIVGTAPAVLAAYDRRMAVASNWVCVPPGQDSDVRPTLRCVGVELPVSTLEAEIDDIAAPRYVRPWRHSGGGHVGMVFAFLTR